MTDVENIQTVETGREATILETISQILSAVFNPFLVPSFAFVLLFIFTYLNIMPLQYVMFVIGIVVVFTIAFPWIFIGLYKWTNRLSMKEVSERKKRTIPYLLTIMSYGTCLILMSRMHFPHYFSNIIAASLMCISTCFLLNLRWRISIHMAGCGMLLGGLLAYSYLFLFNPIWWLCGFILLTGIQGTARISYQKHTLLEIITGIVVGMFCGIVGILFI